jgi:hypothetical protein
MTPTHFDDRGRTVQEGVNAWREAAEAALAARRDPPKRKEPLP